MRDSKFLQRLTRELPAWVEHDWVQPEHQRAILEHVAAQTSGGTRYLTIAFALMGVLLLGSGVITFFAANWQALPKLGKLIILFGGMWVAYGGAAYFRGHAPKLADALILLGVILFGANIHLIAQIYHIDAHYPNGVLMWALGALLAAYLLESQLAMIAALLLGLVWSGMEGWNFEQRFHWPFLVLWIACLQPIVTRQWQGAFHAALSVLLIWCIMTFFNGMWSSHREIYLAQCFFLFFVALLVLGMLCATTERFRSLSVITERYAAIGAGLAFFVLTFPRVYTGRYWDKADAVNMACEITSIGWLIATAALALIAIGLAFWHRARTQAQARPRFLDVGMAILAVVVSLMVTNWLWRGADGSIMPILFNLLFFAALVWLVYAGIHLNDRYLVNLAFVFFALLVLARYFDTFWTLMNRSFFFMAGGLLLMIGGYALERGRRKLTREIPSGGAP